MNEILDEVKIKNGRTLFSKLSLVAALTTLSLLTYLFLSIPTSLHVREGFAHPPQIVVIASCFCCLIGIAMTILSFAQREPGSWYKWLGGVLNMLLLLLIVGLVIFSKVV